MQEQELKLPDGVAAATLGAQLLETPVTSIRIATAIGDDRGILPSVEVTESCRAALTETLAADPQALLVEFTTCLLTRDVDHALQWLFDIGFITAYLPELAATKDLTQEGGRRHKDVWEHTKLVVKQAVRRPSLRWGALLHDIGKVPTRTFTDKGVHFHGHAEVGARMFGKVSRRIPFDRPMRKKIQALIRHHLRASQYAHEWTDSAVRRFDREMGEHLVDLLDLSRADITSKRPGRRQSLLKQISQLSDRIDDLRAADAVQPTLHKGIGTAIMEHFGLPPSRRIGDLKRLLEKAIDDGELEARREDEYYLEWLGPRLESS